MENEQIIRYLKKYRGQYPLISLIENLKKQAGVTEAQIEAAIETVYQKQNIPEVIDVQPASMDTVPVRLCAEEVKKYLKRLMQASVALFICPFLVMILGLFGVYFGYGAILLSCGLGAWFLIPTQKELNRLIKKYG